MKENTLSLGADTVAGFAIGSVNGWNEIAVTLIIVLGRIAIQWIISKYGNNNKNQDQGSGGSGGALSVSL
jgi:hypothetical protein